MPILLAALLAAPRLHTMETELKNIPPREPWVFRSVLDKRARIVTLALAKDFWLAYDATNCGIYKFWKGDVKFDGAVYTTTHGPQPTSLGGAIEQGIVDAPVWFVKTGDQSVPVKPRFRGYAFDTKNKTVVTLQYDVPLKSGFIRVEETPTLAWESGKAVGLRRQLRLVNAPKGQQLGVTIFKGGSAVESTKATGGKVERTGSGDTTFTLDGDLGTVTTFFNPVLSKTASVEEQAASLFASLDAGVAEEPQDKKDEEPREPGLAFRAWQLEIAPNEMPKLVPNQTPNVNKLVKDVNFNTAKDFGLEDHFYAELTGWIKIEKPGLIFFRIGSDDGSKLMIRGEQVIDNDGLHSGEYKEGSLDLNKGSHAIKIEYFENEADEALRLQWKLPGDKDWSFVPNSAFETIADEVHVTSPGNKKVLSGLWPTRPGDGRPLQAVHPSFDLSTPRPDGFTPRVGGMDFLPDGRLVICTWDPDGAVYVLDGVQTGDPKKVKMKRIAIGLAEPLGLKVVNGTIYVLQKQELTKLVDKDGDEIIDEYFAVANGWGVTSNFHEFAFGLVYKDGFFYGNLATAINPGGSSTRPQNLDRGRTLKINAKTGDFEFVAAGLRTPNGIGQNLKGEIFLMDNQGDWLPSSKLLWLTKGAFFGNRSVDPEGTKDLKDNEPVVWLPQGEIGNSPSQPTWLNIGPYKDQMIHGDVTHGGLKRVFMEKIGGQYQGTVFRFTQGLEAGINRVVWGPDNAIYVGGIGSTGNWGQDGKERYGLQRLAYNGKTTFEMLAVRPMKNGAEIEFTEPIAADQQFNLADLTVQQWKYVPTIEYGGPKVDEKKLKVKSLTLSTDRKKLFVEFDGTLPKHVIYMKLPAMLKAADGQYMWSTESWSTVNIIPNRTGKIKPIQVSNSANTLLPEEKADGFVSLFDGSNMDAWRGFRRDDLPKGWNIQDGTLTYFPGIGGGDITTKQQYGDFELRLDWRISDGGNSGIMYRVHDDKPAAYETGVEYQVLDDSKHADGKNPITSAGSAYAMIAPNKKVVNPANYWNQTRIVAKGNKVEHWLNGVKVVEYDTTSAEWKKLYGASKFRGMPDYSKFTSGYIVLQDHGNLVSYRNIRIKKL